MRVTVDSTEGPIAVPSPDHRWTALFFITEPGIGEILPELAGCTTGLCTVRDDAARFARAGVRALGVSAHAPGHLADFAASRDLGYPLLGDGDLALGRALGVPEVKAGDRTLFARAAVVLDRAGAVRALIHPIPDPERHAEIVLEAVAELEAAAGSEASAGTEPAAGAEAAAGGGAGHTGERVGERAGEQVREHAGDRGAEPDGERP
ncbi:redoxin domain-containing protein [Streptomyces roseicoloratus]|uniref:redoxin domain-containing protein n=1 Tax=Streptomyces roseicoloratus TaxID=2508722 RepID=UPI0035A5DCB5